MEVPWTMRINAVDEFIGILPIWFTLMVVGLNIYE